jgi:hypothetical protein
MTRTFSLRHWAINLAVSAPFQAFLWLGSEKQSSRCILCCREVKFHSVVMLVVEVDDEVRSAVATDISAKPIPSHRTSFTIWAPVGMNSLLAAILQFH